LSLPFYGLRILRLLNGFHNHYREAKSVINGGRMNPGNPVETSRTSFSWEKAATASLLLIGVLLRLRQYLTGRSLWVDEAMLALNIVNRGLVGMFQPLDYDQGAPIGFLLVEKIFNLILGKNEFALRLFPLLVGLLSLGLFYLLLQRTTKGIGLLTALALFALNPRLIYYSSEVKQYIVDAAVTIVLLVLAAPLFDPAPRKKDFVRLLLAGVIALWFSHPAVFVLAGIGLTLVILHLRRRDFASLRFVLGMGCLWVLNLGLLYLLILRDLSRNAYMREYWQGAFAPLPPWSDPAWFVRCISENIRMQFGMPYGVFFVFALMLLGWLVLFLRQRSYAIAIACIFLVTWIAASLQLYPAFERMILFLVPVGLILLGAAVQGLYERLQGYLDTDNTEKTEESVKGRKESVLSVSRKHLSPVKLTGLLAALLLAGFLLYGPLTASVQAFITPKYAGHIRPSMEHLRDSWKDGDVT